MAVDIRKLLVLKAFYMGHAISETKHNIAVALDMIDTAIRSLEKNQNRQDQLRLLFYVLLKSEILRETADVLELRAYAKDISEGLGGRVFGYFMAVEESTQTRKRIYGIKVGVVADEGVKNPTFSHDEKDGIYVRRVHADGACRAIGVEKDQLTKKEINFLYKVTLKEMLEKHGIQYAP